MTVEPNLSDRLAMAVGWVAIEAAEVEFAAAQLQAQLLCSPRALSIVLGQTWQPLKQGIDAVVAAQLAECEADPLRTGEIARYKAVTTTMREADVLMSQRGNVIHALWLGLENQNPRSPVTIKRWGRRTETAWTGEQLEQLRHDLRQIRDEIAAHGEHEALT